MPCCPTGSRSAGGGASTGCPKLLRAHVAGSGVTDVYCFLPAEHLEALAGLELDGAEVHRSVLTEDGDALEEQGRALIRLLREGA